MATVYQVCSMVFSYPDEQWKQRVSAVCVEAREHLGLQDLAIIESLAKDIELAALQNEHYRLFSSAGKVGLDLVRHLEPNPVGQAQRLASLAGTYRAFGVEPVAGRFDEPQTLLELLAWLEAKLAWAEQNAQSEAVEVSVEAIREILKNWLIPGFEEFQSKLATEGVLEIYQMTTRCALAHAKKTQACFEALAPPVAELGGSR